MTRAPARAYLYRGPGHVIEIDDVVVRRDVPCELSDDQVARIKAADRLAYLVAVETAKED